MKVDVTVDKRKKFKEAESKPKVQEGDEIW